MRFINKLLLLLIIIMLVSFVQKLASLPPVHSCTQYTVSLYSGNKNISQVNEANKEDVCTYWPQ